MKRTLLLAAAAAPLLALPGFARADDAAPAATSDFDVSAELGLLSDYRFRGLSLSGRDFETTAQVAVSHKSGLYGSLWVSNVDLGAGKADDMEMDWTAGYTKSVGPVSLDVGTIYYSYLNHHDLNYIEVYGSVGTQVGPANVKLGVAYAPKQSHIGDRTNTYVYVSGDLPVSDRFGLHGSFGYEDGAFGDKKKDWMLGASFQVVPGLKLGADYIDTAHSLTKMGDPTVVASVKYAF